MIFPNVSLSEWIKKYSELDIEEDECIDCEDGLHSWLSLGSLNNMRDLVNIPIVISVSVLAAICASIADMME